LDSGEFAKEADQIGLGIDAVGLAGLDQRIKVGTRMGASHGIGEQPVATADYEGTDDDVNLSGVDSTQSDR